MTPFGRRTRQILVDLKPGQLIIARGITNAVSAQNLILPNRSLRLADREYTVIQNSKPDEIATLNDVPARMSNGVLISHTRGGQRTRWVSGAKMVLLFVPAVFS